MKTIPYIGFVIALAFLYTSCEKVEKDVKNYYPSVKTVSVQNLGYGNVLVKGVIESNGHTNVEIAGFCMSSSPEPGMLDNQAIGTFFDKDSFQVIYSNHWENKVYYFRSWAVNEENYSYGEILPLENIATSPVKAPCSPTLNYVSFYDSWSQSTRIIETTLPEYSFSSETWAIDVSCFTGNFSIEFGSRPTSGKYSLTSNETLMQNEARLSFYTGSSSAILMEGSVYVNETSTDHWTITVCETPWGTTGGNSFTTAFKIPL